MKIMKHNKKVVEQSRFYSNGKLLLTGEYFVLKGSKALAVPTKFGQNLSVEALDEPKLIWNSYDKDNNCWLEVIFELPKLRLMSASFPSNNEGSREFLAEKLGQILLEVRKLNPSFLTSEKGFLVKTSLNFPQNWGLGSSSTLINNLAYWANVNPYELLKNTFGGSGYDIACAQAHSAIFYTKRAENVLVKKVHFNPTFKNQLYFVYLNKKQNSREGIEYFNKIKNKISSEIEEISMLSEAFLNCSNINDFEKLMNEHEQIVSKTLKLKTVQELCFSDYFGQTKSLGAWGGDFVLATGNENSSKYFQEKGFETVIPFNKMAL